MSVPDEAVALNQMDRIMNGDNEFMKSVFRELANLPADAWKEINAFVDRLNATDTKNL